MHLFHSRLPEKTAFLRLVELGLIVACCAKHASNSLWIKETQYSLPFSGQDQAAKNKKLQVFSRSAVPRIQFNFGQLPKYRPRRGWLLWCTSIGEFQSSRLFQKIRSWLNRVIKQMLGRLEEQSNAEMGPWDQRELLDIIKHFTHWLKLKMIFISSLHTVLLIPAS